MRLLIITMSLMILIFVPDLAADQPIRICDDESEWPPYTFYKRMNGQPDKSKLTGAVVELLDEVFKRIEKNF